MLKKLPPKGLVLMATLFNFFPAIWKVSTIILNKKTGKDKTNPDSYRSISLLTSISKLFEKIIRTRLFTNLKSPISFQNFNLGLDQVTQLSTNFFI